MIDADPRRDKFDTILHIEEVKAALRDGLNETNVSLSIEDRDAYMELVIALDGQEKKKILSAHIQKAAQLFPGNSFVILFQALRDLQDQIAPEKLPAMIPAIIRICMLAHPFFARGSTNLTIGDIRDMEDDLAEGEALLGDARPVAELSVEDVKKWDDIEKALINRNFMK